MLLAIILSKVAVWGTSQAVTHQMADTFGMIILSSEMFKFWQKKQTKHAAVTIAPTRISSYAAKSP